MDKVEEMATRIDMLPIGSTSYELDKARSIKCIAYGCMAIAYAIKELTQIFVERMDKKE